jgi:hypothetical protein
VRLNRKFSFTYLALFAAIVGVELFGVVSPGEGDTITENWHWLDAHAGSWGSWLLRVFTVGLLGWTALHFRKKDW